MPKKGQALIGGRRRKRTYRAVRWQPSEPGGPLRLEIMPDDLDARTTDHVVEIPTHRARVMLEELSRAIG